MRKAQLPTGPMADLLLALESAHGGKDAAGGQPGWLSLLSSHPETALRARKLKEGRPDGC
jgi:hypothetical protein